MIIALSVSTLLSISICCAGTAPQPDTLVQGGMLRESVIVSSKRPAIGMERLTADRFRTFPAVLGETDVLKAVHMIPGISGGKEGNAGVMIRGGDYDQTDFRFDGASLYNPVHLLGFVSAFNPGTTDGMDLYKGELPAWLGERLSGVVDVRSRNGNAEEYHIGMNAGLLSSNIWVEGPLVKEKLSFIAGARKSYFNFSVYPAYRKIADKGSFLDAFDSLGYFDANARLSYRPGDRDNLALTFYMGSDDMDLGRNRMEGTMALAAVQSEYGDVKRDYKYDSRAHQSWGNTMGSLDWNHVYRGGGRLNGTLSYVFSRNDFNRKSHLEYLNYAERNDVITELQEGLEDESFLRRNKVDDLKADFSFSKSSGGHSITLGATASMQHLGLGYRSKSTSEVSVPGTDSTSRINTVALYADDVLQIIPGLDIRAGLRGQMWSVKNRTFLLLDPRLSVRWMPGDGFSIAAGYNRTSQAIHQMISSSIVSPGDIWVPVTQDIRPMTANHFFLETDSSIPMGDNPLKFKVEGYYKTMNNLLEWTDLALVSENADWKQNVSTGRGTAYGLEFSAEKTIGKLNTSLAYTLSKSVRCFDSICGGEEFFAANDRRHNLNVTARYCFSSKWDVSAAFFYHTGDRFTLNSFEGLGNMFIYKTPAVSTIPLNADVRNNCCLKDYHRMDISLNYHIHHRKVRSTINLSIYNIYNRLNPYTVQYYRDEEGRPVIYNVCIMPFMPSISFSIEM